MKGNHENLKEEFWNGINELKKAQDRLSKSQEETDRKFQETAEQMKETDRKIQETAEQMKETDRKIQETAEQMKETDRKIQKTDEYMEKLGDELKEANGNFNNKWGLFLENLVEGDLVKILKERGIEIDRIQPRLILKGVKKGISEGEIDLIAVNGKELVAVEVKNDLRKEYVDRFVEQLKKLKKICPEYRDKKVYGGMAYLGCQDERALDALKKNGLFIIKAVGGKTDVSIIDNPKDFRPKEY